MKKVLTTLSSIAVVVLFAAAVTASDDPVLEEPLVSSIDVPRAVGEAIAFSGVGVHFAGVGGTHYGSGVLLDDGYVLTAAHVVQCTDKLFVTALADQRKRRARVVAFDDGLDLALLQVKLPRKTELRALELAAEHPRRATRIFGWGRMSSIAAGKVTSGSDRELLARMPVRGGDSGGAALDVDGRLVGILSRAQFTAPMAFFVPLADIRLFLDGVDRSKTVSEAALCDRDRLVWADLKDAGKLNRRGLRSDAILRLDQVLGRNPEPEIEARARSIRAKIRRAQGDKEETLIEAEAAVAAAPALLEIRRTLLAALSGLGRWRQVHEEVLGLLAVDPGDPWLWRTRIHAAKHLGTKAAALQALDAYVAQTEGPARGEALAVRCSLALKRGAVEDARVDCDQAIALGHEMTWMHVQMADADRDAGRYAEAVDSYLRAMDMGAGKPKWARRCARLLLVLGRDADAIQLLTGVPLTDAARWTAIVAGVRLGRMEFALEQLANAVSDLEQPGRFVSLQKHLAAGGTLGAATVEGQVEFLHPE